MSYSRSQIRNVSVVGEDTPAPQSSEGARLSNSFRPDSQVAIAHGRILRESDILSWSGPYSGARASSFPRQTLSCCVPIACISAAHRAAAIIRFHPLRSPKSWFILAKTNCSAQLNYIPPTLNGHGAHCEKTDGSCRNSTISGLRYSNVGPNRSSSFSPRL